MPNWCDNTITIQGDTTTLFYMDQTMRSEGHEVASDDDPAMGQPMLLIPMPEVLRGTRSPTPEGDYDPEGTWMEWVNDPDNEFWTAEKYEADQAEHYALIERAERAKAETGYADWYSWASNEWGTKWSMDVYSYTYATDSETITISGSTAWGPPIALLEKVSQKYGVKVSLTYVEEGMDFIGASVIIDGESYDSSGSFSDHLPEGFDWDDEDAWEIRDDVRGTLIDHHEGIAAMEASLVTS